MGGVCPDDAGFDAAPPIDAPGADVPGLDAPRADTSGIDGGGSCIEAWSCGPWETSGTSDAASRVCTDANACGTTATRPAISATLPSLDFDYYECNVEPILDHGCAQLACHGTDEGRALRTYARGRHRIVGETFVEPGCLSAGTPHPSEDCEGSVECRCWTLPHSPAEWRRNFDSARGFGLDPITGAPLGDVTASHLLTQPLIGGGPAHGGFKFWRSSDADYQSILDWLNGATLGRTCNSRN